MKIIDVGVCLVFLVFFGFSGCALEDKEVIKGVLSGFQLVSSSQLSDDTLVEVLENSCRLELLLLKRIYEDLGFTIPKTPVTSTRKVIHDQALPEKDIQKVLYFLDPQIKQNLFKCLKENYAVSPVSGEEVGPVGWLQKHLGYLLPTSNHAINSRRQLAEGPSPALTPAQASSPALTPVQAPSPGPSGAKRSSAKGRAPSPVETSLIPIPVPVGSPSLDGGVNTTGGHHSDNHKTVIVAVVVTATVTFFVALIVFLCCRKFSGGSGLDHKDDRPLLRLSTSDYSASDNLSKTWAFQNSDDKGKNNNQLYSNNFNNTIGVVTSGGKASAQGTVKPVTESLSGDSPNESSSALKPPPGRNGRPSLGFSPLKPLPGRADPLPPEPPVSTRMGGPPPPPPPKLPAAPPPPPKLPAAPPPPPKKTGPPPPPPSGVKPGPHAPPPRPPPVSVKAGSSSGDANAAKAKLKPFFWDKVMANPDHSMVWDQIKSGSFQFNEEMIESLFGYASAENKNEKNKDSSSHQAPQFIQLIDPKKAQNLSILLRALNVSTEEVCDALQEGNELPPELLETLLKMAPTTEEELKLRLFSGEISLLGSAERFLKVMVDIPFAFKRIEVLLFMGTLQEEATTVKDNFVTLEAACKELRSSRLFLKLLEAVLKTGNRMNDGTYRGGALAFKLDTLLKLADVKGTDGKTTLLHFVVQEIIRSEGMRAARAAQESKSMSSIKSEDLLEDVPEDSEDHYRSLGLEVVSGVGNQLQNVRKAAGLDSDSVTGTIAKLSSGLHKAKNFLNKEFDETNEEKGFHKALKSFVENAEADVVLLLEEEKRIMGLVKSTVDYFHGNSGKEEGLRLFVIVRDFLIMLDKVCREVKARPKWPSKTQKKEPPTRQTSSETPRTPFSPDFRQRLFPAIAERRMDGSSSDDD